MAIQVTCAHCGKRMQAPDNLAGRKAKCPNCKQVIAIPPAPGAAPESAAPSSPAPATTGDAVSELARALERASSRPRGSGEPASMTAAFEPSDREEPSAAGAPPEAAIPLAPIPVPAATESAAKSESDELIAMPPVGVQTPSGLSTVRHAAQIQTYRWQKRLAGLVRTGGFILAMFLLVLGTATLLVMAIQGGRAMLAPGLAIFVLMVILAVVVALGGLLARHLLLLMTELSEDARRKQELLDRISERLE